MDTTTTRFTVHPDDADGDLRCDLCGTHLEPGTVAHRQDTPGTPSGTLILCATACGHNLPLWAMEDEKMKAIQTRYLGPTNYRGSRIKAFAEGVKSLTIPYPYELSGDAVHRKAAEALCDRMGWAGDLACGGLPNGDYAFTFASTTKPRTEA